jgi:hypothetical protein
MEILSWFLVITVANSDELLVKEMRSKEECIKVQKQFAKKAQKKIRQIQDVTCEYGTITNPIPANAPKEEYL